MLLTYSPLPCTMSKLFFLSLWSTPHFLLCFHIVFLLPSYPTFLISLLAGKYNHSYSMPYVSDCLFSLSCKGMFLSSLSSRILFTLYEYFFLCSMSTTVLPRTSSLLSLALYLPLFPWVGKRARVYALTLRVRNCCEAPDRGSWEW